MIDKITCRNKILIQVDKICTISSRCNITNHKIISHVNLKSKAVPLDSLKPSKATRATTFPYHHRDTAVTRPARTWEAKMCIWTALTMLSLKTKETYRICQIEMLIIMLAGINLSFSSHKQSQTNSSAIPTLDHQEMWDLTLARACKTHHLICTARQRCSSKLTLSRIRCKTWKCQVSNSTNSSFSQIRIMATSLHLCMIPQIKRVLKWWTKRIRLKLKIEWSINSKLINRVARILQMLRRKYTS